MDDMENIRVKSWLEHLILIASGHIKDGFHPKQCAMCEEIQEFMDKPSSKSKA